MLNLIYATQVQCLYMLSLDLILLFQVRQPLLGVHHQSLCNMALTKHSELSGKDLTIENITQNVHIINSQCEDRRLKYLLERAVVHLHDFVRETRLSTDEWMAAIHFLTAVGQICTSVRQVRPCILSEMDMRNLHAHEVSLSDYY